MPTDSGTAASARLCFDRFASGGLAVHDDDPAAAIVPLQRAVALRRELGNPRELARSLGNLGDASELASDDAAARTSYEEALSIGRALEQPRIVAFGLMCIGSLVHRSGDSQAALPMLEEAMSVARSVGPWAEGRISRELGLADGPPSMP
jgi:hypothetical protein